MSRSISPYERFGQLAPIEDASLRVHIFNASETLTGIAHRFLGDWRLWRLIADRNSIADVRVIEPGASLLIPQKPLERGYERL